MPNIIRQKRKANYTVIPNEMLNNENLSFKAKAILCYLLSKPDRWSVYLSQLAKASSDGYESVVSGMNELIANRYVFRKPCSGSNPGGWEYFVYDEPQASDESPLGDSPIRDFTESGKPMTNKERLNEVNKEIKVNPKPLQEGVKEISAMASSSKTELVSPKGTDVDADAESGKSDDLISRPPSGVKSVTGRGRKISPPTTIPPELDCQSFRDAWNDFLTHRKEKRKPVTPTSERILFKNFIQWGSSRATEALRTTVLKGWTGVFEPPEEEWKPTTI